MKFRLLAAATVAAAALTGCVTYDDARSRAPGGYYYGRPSVEYYGSPYGYPYYGGGYGSGYYGYGYPRGYYPGGYYPAYPVYPVRPIRPRPPRPGGDHGDHRPPSGPGGDVRPPTSGRPPWRNPPSGNVQRPPRADAAPRPVRPVTQSLPRSTPAQRAARNGTRIKDIEP